MSTEEIFTDIYTKNRWGGKSGTFHSGTGSAADRIVDAYVTAVRSWLQEVGADTMTVVDLGCGDFQVSQQLVDRCQQYIGVDIVRGLVEHNNVTFGSPRVEFRHLDAIDAPLPEGSICLVRQVLQHLSNEQIAAILPKLMKFRWAVITEHQPSPHLLRQPNLDKPPGTDIRVFHGSGVFLEEPPFSFPREKLRLLLEVAGHDFASGADPGCIRTFVLSREESDVQPTHKP